MEDNIKVLYVDDETDLLKLGEIYLTRLSAFSVTTASKAAEAINLLSTEKFDVIVSDYQMPGMDGILFLKYLKEHGDNTPFILFTGRGREEVVIEALNSGADFYLQKGGDPVAQFTELSHQIQIAASRRCADLDLVRKNEELCTVNEELIATEEELRINYEELIRKEQVIRESEERFRAVFNSSLVGIAITNPKGTWLYFNDTLCTMLGYSQDELKTKTWGDLTPPEELEDEMILFREVLAGKVPENIEKQYIRRDGSRVDVIVSTGVVRNPDGTIAYFSSVIQDITYRKVAEQILIQKNEELHAAFELTCASEKELSAQVYNLKKQERELRITENRLLWAQEIGKTGAWEYDPKANTIWGSAEGLSIFGFPRIAGDFPINEIEACIPDKERVNRALVDLITRDIPYDLEYVIHPADGSERKVIHSMARAEKDTAGNVTRVIGIIQDITRQKQLEQDQQTLIATLGETNEKLESAYEELASSEEELRTQYNSLAQTEESLRETNEYLENLFAIANVPIIVWDSEFRIVRINQACELIIGRTATEVIGTPLTTLFSPDQTFHLSRLLDTTHSGVRWDTVEVSVLHQDGSVRTIIWNTSTLFDSDGITPVATIAQGRDVTDERRHAHAKEIALVEIQKNLAKLAILNDEIRNPLTIIVACADLYDNDYLIDTIMVQAQRIDAMVNTLDKRWVESEKVLNAIRKHYQIEIIKFSESGEEENAGYKVPLTGSGIRSGTGEPYRPLVEEVQAQLYSILDSIDALVYVADMSSYDLLYINQRGRSQYGNCAGKKCFQILFPGQDTPCSFCTNHLLVHEERSTGVYSWEFEDTRNGRWFDCRDRAIRWSDGRLVRLEIATDITERKQTEVLLRQSEERFSTIFSTAQVGIVLIDAESHEIIQVNPKALEMIGALEEEVIGRNCHTFICPADLGKCPVTDLYQTMNTSERIIIRQNGDRVPILKTVVQQLIDGRNVLVESFVDITELRQTEHKLRESEQKFRLLAENIGDVIWTADKDMQLTYISPSITTLTGYSPEEFITLDPQDSLTQKSLDRLTRSRREFLNHISSGTIDQCLPEVLELEYRKKDGTIVVTECRISLFLTDKGEPSGVTGVSRDITERILAEEALRENEKRYREIFESLDDLYYQTDEKGIIAVLSPSVYSLSGWTTDELIGTPASDLYVHPEDRELLLSELAKTGFVKDYELLLRKNDGTPMSISLSASVIMNADGTSGGLRGALRDITTRKKTEESLRYYQKLFSDVIQFLPDATFAINLKGEVIIWNKAIEVMSGIPASVMMGKGDYAYAIPFYGEARPMLIDFVLKSPDMIDTNYSSSIRDRDSYTGEVFCEALNDNKGSWVFSKSSLIYDESGCVIGAIQSIRDITKTTIAEEKVKQLLNQIEFILEATHTGLDIIDKNFNLRYVNTGWATRYGDFKGRKCYEFFMGRDDACVGCQVQTILETRKPSRSEQVLVNEGNRPIEVVSIPFRDENGEWLVAEINIDISERIKAEEALQTSNQKLHLLTRLTRHDVTNQLTSLHLLLNLAADSLDPLQKDEYIKKAMQAADQAMAIIGFTREYESFGVVFSGWQQVDSLIRLAESETEHSGILIDNFIPPDIQIFADPIISKVFFTLTENAIRHGESVSRITYSSMISGTELLIFCQDDGKGIATEEKELIFDQGYGKNTGMGLFLAREILAITGLSIRETGEPGKGARFEILVPEGRWQRDG